MENKNEDLRFMQLRFIGKILAGFTHEIKNHLAIVKESAGLMGDMIKIGKTVENDSSQYLEIIRSIEEQIEKAIVHFTYLNRFSHRMDTELSTFNVNETLEELIALVTRFANQRKISIEKDFQKDISSINNNPSIFQLLVFYLIEEQLTRLDINSRLILKTETANGSIAIRIIPKGKVLDADREEGSVSNEIREDIIKYLGGNLSISKEGIVIKLQIKPL